MVQWFIETGRTMMRVCLKDTMSKHDVEGNDTAVRHVRNLPPLHKEQHLVSRNTDTKKKKRTFPHFGPWKVGWQGRV